MRLGYLVGGLGLAVVMVGGPSSANATTSLTTLLLSRQSQAKPTITTSAVSSSTSSKVQAASAPGPNIDSDNVINGFQNVVDRLRAQTNETRCRLGQTRFCVTPH